MKSIKIIALIFCLGHLSLSYAQLNEAELNTEALYQDGISAFNEGTYFEAWHSFEKYLSKGSGKGIDFDLFDVQSRIYEVKTAFDLNQENADDLLIALENQIPNHIFLHDAYMSRGNYYFRKKDYTQAIVTFENIKLNLLNREASQTVKFKLAYSYFVKKRFNEAAVLFGELSYVKNQYYYPANYYLGICQFLRSDFDEAIKSFKIVEDKKEYKQHIPYYLVQLYFSQENYDETIGYGEAQLQKEDIKNRFKISHLLAASYFILEQYKAALPHFEKYEQNTEKLSESDFYQLAYIYYQLGNCEKAIPHFKELTDIDGPFGQNANYYLADCYLKNGEKLSARTALKKVSEFSIKNNMQEESLLNFGKLSAEMGYDREAIDALFKIPSNSLYYNEAQDILGELFVQTKDYAKAQFMLESKDEVSHQLFEAYQKVCYFKALQSLQNGSEDDAIEDLKKAIKTDRDLSITAKSYYWLAEIAQRKGNYLESSHRLIKYFLLIKGVEEIAGQASPAFAHYVQGYNYIKLGQYQAAYDEFIASLDQLPETVAENQQIKNRINTNARLRAGDCALKEKQFDLALKHYQYIIDGNSRFVPYAMFQKAIILHLTNNIYGSISLLQSIVQNFPQSSMFGLSLMHLGDMYIELNEPSKAYDAFLGLVKSELKLHTVQNKAYLKLGLLSYNLGDIEKANAYYKNVLSNNPSGNERKEALDALEEIFINDINRPGEYLTIAKVIGGVELNDMYRDSITFASAKNVYNKDSMQLAVREFSSYIEQYPRGYFAVESFFFRGKAYLAEKKYNKAYEDFVHVIDLGPGEYYAEALFNAAVVSFNYKKDFQSAYNHYVRLEGQLSNETKIFDAQLGALRSAFRINNFKGVQRYADKVVRNSLASKKEITSAHYYLGKVAFKHQQFDNALKSLNRVIHLMKNSNQAAEARYIIARIYFERGEYTIAEELCKSANTVNSAYPYWVAKSLLLFSDILLKKDDFFNARAALEATIENYQEDKKIVAEAKFKLKEVIKLQHENSRLEKENVDGTIKMDTIDE